MSSPALAGIVLLFFYRSDRDSNIIALIIGASITSMLFLPALVM
jgi:hypothetical protein